MTMSAFVIGETTNNKQYSTPIKTHVWIVSSRNVLAGCESEAPDCPCNVGIALLYRNRLCASQHCRLTLLFQVQEIVLRKMRRTYSNIWVELFWNSVVNKLNYRFLVVSSFESPKKVLSLSQWNTASPRYGISGSKKTTARINVLPSFIACTFGRCFANLHISSVGGRIWMSRFRGPWQSLNFDKQYLFGFETLVFAASGTLSMHNQLTLQRERKAWNRIIWPL